MTETYSDVFWGGFDGFWFLRLNALVILFYFTSINLLFTLLNLFLKKLYLLFLSLEGKMDDDDVVVVCAIFTSVCGLYYSVWAVPYGDSMLCVLTLSLPSWFCAISLLKYTWMWAIIQRVQDVCDS